MEEKEKTIVKRRDLKLSVKSIWPLILAGVAMSVYYSMEAIVEGVLPYTKYYYAPNFAAELAANEVRRSISYPISDFIEIGQGLGFAIIPFYLMLSYLLFFLHLKIKFTYKYIFSVVFIVLLFLRVAPGTLRLFEGKAESISHGKSTNGYIENAKRIPFSGKGYYTYSFWGYLLGRTYVHSSVKAALRESFEEAARTCKGRKFVIGETGLKEGGPIALHKGKQNGLQVDILLPLDIDGEPYNSCNISHLWFYRTGFERTNGLKAFLKDYEVNYQHLAIHLLSLMKTAPKHGLAISKIEIHRDIKKNLLSRQNGKALKQFFAFGGRKESKDKPAYYTITFSEASVPIEKGIKKLLNRNN